MTRKQIYICDTCGENPTSTGEVSDECPCGGKYTPMPAQTQSTYGSLGIDRHKRKTKGFRRTKI